MLRDSSSKRGSRQAAVPGQRPTGTQAAPEAGTSSRKAVQRRLRPLREALAAPPRSPGRPRAQAAPARLCGPWAAPGESRAQASGTLPMSAAHRPGGPSASLAWLKGPRDFSLPSLLPQREYWPCLPVPPMGLGLQASSCARLTASPRLLRGPPLLLGEVARQLHHRTQALPSAGPDPPTVVSVLVTSCPAPTPCDHATVRASGCVTTGL